ncbi:hypothetical protein OXX59_010136, partial [Metschnikowia pulcherrima]
PAPKKTVESKASQAAAQQPETVQTESEIAPEEETAAPVEEEAHAFQKDATTAAYAEPEQPVEAAPAPVLESEVVLPQQVSNVGVSFGSLSLGESQQQPAQEEQTEPVQQESYKQQETESAQPAEHAQQDQSSTQDHQSQQQQSQEIQQQTEQQAYQQQFEQQRKATSSQGYDYYSQFQQSQQQ